MEQKRQRHTDATKHPRRHRLGDQALPFVIGFAIALVGVSTALLLLWFL
ncbi:MAG: hypothetical protein ACOC9Y_10885 [Chloroflexota bacterium]